MNKATTVGLDLAKEIFHVHAVDAKGSAVENRRLKRRQLVQYFAQREPCLVGMEACASAHHWARKLSAFGHTVKLVAPQFVKPYVKTNKNDARDAEAICEAVTRPSMRFVPIKTADPQALLSRHRARAGFVTARTAQANQIRGLLAEFGIVIPKGIGNVTKRLPGLREDAENDLPGMMRELLERLGAHIKALDRQVRELESAIQRWHRENTASRKLAAIPGIGPITASVLTATVADARSFRSGRELAAWLGLVPRQHSSGGKDVLGRIAKRGDVSLRTLLIHGARAVIRYAAQRADQPDSWLTRLLARRNKNVAAVALANKNARIAWALLAHPEREYRADYMPARTAA